LAWIFSSSAVNKPQRYDKDLYILSFLKEALNRPAFNTPFHAENNCEDFIKAISDTQRAFTTGRLFDRDRHLLSSAYAAVKLSKPADRSDATKIERLLQDIRNMTTENLANGNIVQEHNFLVFPRDWELKISEKLNKLRAEVVLLFNKMLKRHNIELIEYPIRGY
jgi:hypothetical protein